MNSRQIRTYLFSSVSLILVIFLGWFLIPNPELVEVAEKWKGVCWVAGRSPLEGGELHALKKVGANALSQTPFGWQSEKNRPEIRWQLEGDRIWWGESAKGIQITLDSSETHGIMNMLKPHLWVRGSWPGEIEMESEEDWGQWFDNYRGFILEYAALAEKLAIPMLCIGTELEKTSHRGEDWSRLIREIRNIYSGKLTYAANFTEFEQVSFWDELDYVGIQAYFPLSDSHDPSLNDLMESWESHISSIEKVVRKYKKPVIFTEIGYCNTVDAAMEPWVWPNERAEIALSDEVQALCYEAFFQTAWRESWLAGVFFWKWYPNGGRRSPDFTPQGKSAESVMEAYFLED
ncbi:hypothetical protein [Algoriphagus sp. CAU 1675]|uniref:glycoside hydrolase family 113 n=1 Tax=Algoriphagus sp. CAU 1675 TaxID=3032597 RepID=UPI0023DB72D0|nr:hypothetical protein [Algoriphagus sp. CAU 1675]MDF2158431.1 hypothetical protein [Algoriphagus sp. CAU 1675]